MNNITRPLVRYHGGKFLLADWIISHFPEHKIYTETFGGGGSVLLKKPRCYAEIYNDLDGEICNLFEVTRDNGYELKEKLYNTPFSRNEFVLSYKKSEDKVEQARRTVVRAFMGFGSGAVNGKSTGFRSNSNRSGTTPSHDWKNYPEALDAIIERLRGVVIENKDAKKIMLQQDSENTLHYVDPPYKTDSRSKSSSNTYRFEMSDVEHLELANFCQHLKGMVIISGYENEIYDSVLTGWRKEHRKHFADGAKERTEILWLSPNIIQKPKKEIVTLF
jgi:DNA adenine methylase